MPPARACPVIRWSRPMPTVTARCPSRSRSRRPVSDGLCVAAFDEALELRAGGVRAPIHVLYPVPAVCAARGRPARHRARRRRRGGPGGERWRPRRSLTRRGRLRLELEVETGLGRGGFLPAEAVSAAARVAGGARRRAARRVDAPPGGRGRAGHGRAGRPLRGGAGEHRRGRDPAAGPARGRERGAADRRAWPTTASGPGSRSTAWCPTSSTRRSPAERPAPRCARSWRSTLARCASPTCRPASGISYGPTFRTTRPSRIATLPLGYGDGWSRALSNRAWAAWSAACACRSSGTWPWTP